MFFLKKFLPAAALALLPVLSLKAQERNLIIRPFPLNFGIGYGEIGNQIAWYTSKKEGTGIFTYGGSVEYLFRNLSSVRLTYTAGGAYKVPDPVSLLDAGYTHTLHSGNKAFGARAGFMAYAGNIRGAAINSPEATDALGYNTGEISDNVVFPVKSVALYIGLGSSWYDNTEEHLFRNFYADLLFVPKHTISNIRNFTSGIGEYQFNTENRNFNPGHFGVRIGYESTSLKHFGFGYRPEIILYPGGIKAINVNFYVSSGWLAGRKKQK